MNTAIKQAREAYLEKHPFDPKAKAVMALDGNGLPEGFLTMPHLDDVQILAAKLGVEYLAICHDEESVEDWISTVASLAGSRYVSGLIYANAFRGISDLLGEIFQEVGVQDTMTSLAIQGWAKDFSENDFTTKENNE